MIASFLRLMSPLLLVAVTVDAWSADADRWEVLQAINWVENPRNSPRPGPYGELGPYQFRRGTWEMHTSKPFHLAIERAHADEVAVAHYEWLRRGLIRNGLPATPYNVALAWNAGLSAVVNGRVGPRTRRYAQHVVNLVGELKRSQDNAVARN